MSVTLLMTRIRFTSHQHVYHAATSTRDALSSAHVVIPKYRAIWRSPTALHCITTVELNKHQYVFLKLSTDATDNS